MFVFVHACVVCAHICVRVLGVGMEGGVHMHLSVCVVLDRYKHMSLLESVHALMSTKALSLPIPFQQICDSHKLRESQHKTRPHIGNHDPGLTKDLPSNPPSTFCDIHELHETLKVNP